ncbi:MAG: type II secretion system F family protein [Jiangellaceae bacterium]
MSPTLLLVILLGAVVGAGVALLVVALRGTTPPPSSPSGSTAGLVERIGRQTLYGIGAGLLTLVLTRWPIAAVAMGMLVTFWPAMFGGAKAEREAIARLDGLAAWTESLRDTIAGAVGLEQAIPATVYAASPSIRTELRLLVDRLRVRVPMPIALQRFADDLDDPGADLVVAALILNARLRGPGLRQVLTSLSEAARAELDMRQRVFAGRSSTRRSVQIVVGFSLAFTLGLAILNRSYVEPYSTPQGQVVLAVVIGIFAAGFLWMRRLSGVEKPERFLVATAERQPAPTTVGGPA